MRCSGGRVSSPGSRARSTARAVSPATSETWRVPSSSSRRASSFDASSVTVGLLLPSCWVGRRQVRSTSARRPRAHLRGGSRRRSQRGRREVGYLTTRCRILAPSVQPPASQCPSRQPPALRLPWRQARRTTPRSHRAASHGRNTRSALSGAGTTLGAPLREMSGACGDAFTPAQLTVRALSAA